MTAVYGTCCVQVKPEFAAIEKAAISEPGIENSLAREHYTEDTEKVIGLEPIKGVNLTNCTTWTHVIARTLACCHLWLIPRNMVACGKVISADMAPFPGKKVYHSLYTLFTVCIYALSVSCAIRPHFITLFIS